MLCVKKILLAATFVLTIFGPGYSQSPAIEDANGNPAGKIIYIKIYGGYGLLTPGSFTINASTSSIGGGANSSFTTSKVGLGAGLHFGGGVGFNLNDFLNVGIDAEYLKGEDLSISATFSSSPYFSTFNQTLTHSVLSIIPNITFKAVSKPSYYFYTRIGIVVAINTNLEVKERDSTFNAGMGDTFVYLTDVDNKYTYQVNIGAQVAVGAQFRLSEILRGFIEITGNYLPASPVSSVSKSNGREIDNNVETSSADFVHNFTYAKSGNSNFQSSTNGNTTTTSETVPKITHNINYIGLNIGLVLRL